MTGDAEPKGLIVALVSEKGGVGKSTLAGSLAAHWHEQGWKVLGVDLDPQETLQEWSRVAQENGLAAPPVVGMGDNVRGDVPRLAEQYDITILDCPGRMGRRMMGALLIADVALIPVAAGAPDVWALSRVLEKIDEARAVRPELVAGVVANRMMRTRLAGGAAKALDEIEGVLHCEFALSNRAAFAESFARGSGVTVLEPGSVAALELQKVAFWLEEQLGLGEGSNVEEVSNVA